MNKVLLIELVRACPELYDARRGNYTNSEHKEIIWTFIAKKLDSTPTACKKTWINLRDTFRRSIRNKKHYKNLDKKHAWKFGEHMEFLIPHFHEPKNIVKISEKITHFQQSKNIVKIPEKIAHNFVYEHCENDLQNETLFINPLKIEESIDEDDMSDTKNNNEISMEDMGNVLSNQDDENSIVYEQSKPDPIVIQQDPLDLFFMSIAATMKNFSLYHQNIAKSKIFQIVSEMEMQQILNDKQKHDALSNNETDNLLTPSESSSSSNHFQSF